MRKKEKTTIINDGYIEIEDNEEMKNSHSEQLMENKIIWGWENAEEVANDIWSSIHSTLIKGNLIFAYKNTNSGSELGQIVIVQNQRDYNDFGVGMFTNGFSELLPHVTIDYISEEIIKDLTKYKVNKKIIENLIFIINNIKSSLNKINYGEKN